MHIQTVPLSGFRSPFVLSEGLQQVIALNVRARLCRYVAPTLAIDVQPILTGIADELRSHGL